MQSFFAAELKNNSKRGRIFKKKFFSFTAEPSTTEPIIDDISDIPQYHITIIKIFKASVQ